MRSAPDRMNDGPEGRNEIRAVLREQLAAARAELLAEEAACHLDVAGPQPAMLMKAQVDRFERALEVLGPDEEWQDEVVEPKAKKKPQVNPEVLGAD